MCNDALYNMRSGFMAVKLSWRLQAEITFVWKSWLILSDVHVSDDKINKCEWFNCDTDESGLRD